MNKEQLQNLLNQKYDAANWNKIYGSIFPNVMLFSSPKEIAVTENWVKSFKQRGLVRLQGNQDVAIFEVVLKDGISVQSKRVGLRNLVAKLIDEYQNHGVLAVFDNGSPEYRFTFAAKETKVTREGIEKTETDSKRYTYILGETETCKTAAEQFIKLSEKGSTISLSDLQEAFSVEKLSKQFFTEYKEQYKNFVSYLASQPKILKSVFADDEKKMRDFVKLLLGRLVFLQFVQKKRWLGVPPKNTDWSSGDVKFLVNSYKAFSKKEKYYSDFLEALFFECLNSPNRKNEIFSITGTKVPFLNGGLFENDNPKTKSINFPVSSFEGLFDFFGRYNFTIDENDPTEKEVGIDPEMLGSIFENLLEDKEETGTFYTPKEIVHYMCQESLIEYICTKVNPKNDKKVASKIRSLITERKIDESIKGLIKPIAVALKEVKICDPAIGSGAFPMGMLMEIFHCVFELYNADSIAVSKEWNMNGWQPNVVKSNIIQNSIYGVDIEKGAVDIARLRFWLSLVVDEEEPKALPNLDYKIVVGNSLLSKLGDDVIDIDWTLNETNHGLFGADLAQQRGDLLKKISKEQKEFFNPDSNKKKLAAEIRKLKIDLLITQLELMISTKGIEAKPNGIGKKVAGKTERYKQTLSWRNSIRDLNKLKNKPEWPLNFFEWKLDFPEVLNEHITTNKGFDIVIANPPYVDYRLIDSDITRHSNFPINMSSTRPNLYQYFIELSDTLLSDKGTFCFINPNQFLSTDNGVNLREHLIKNRSIKFIVDVSYLKVFKDASTYTIVWLYNKNINQNNEIRINRCSEIHRISETSFRIKQSDIEISDSKIIPINYEYFALAKIEKDKDTLGNISKLKWGTSATGYGRKKIDVDAYDKLSLSKKQVYRPILQTSDTKKYYIDWQGEYIPINIYSDSIIREFNKTKIVIGRVTKRIQACLDEECCFVGKSTLITDSKLNLKLLLSILNSSFANRWYYLKFETTHMAGGYLRFDIPYLEKLPIPKISKKTESKLIDLTDKIISSKTKDIEIDTISLEQKIDNLVYKLYQLTYDEVKVIDPEFDLSKEEYDKIELE